MRRTKNQQNKFVVILSSSVLQEIDVPLEPMPSKVKPVDQKIILHYYYCMMRMFKSYPELEIAEPTGDLEKMQFSCCLNLSNFSSVSKFVWHPWFALAVLGERCWKKDGSRSNLWTMGGQVHYTHYC